jgi:lipoate-protein ligase A
VRELIGGLENTDHDPEHPRVKPIRLLDLGTATPLRSQTVYHAAAYAMTEDTPDTIILVSPAEPYVCIGFHQDLSREVDSEYCQRHGLPVYRREVGGGAVYLDSGQIFTQWIFKNGQLPAELDQRFKTFIQPLVETYRELGVPAYHRPINDVHVGGKKIGGTGAAAMGQAEVAVGSLMFTFDKKTMARVLKVASEKMRDKIFENLEEYVTTLEEQLRTLPSRQSVKDSYLAHCAQALGREIVPGTWSEREESLAVQWDQTFVSDEWLQQRGTLLQRGVKIHEDVRVLESAHKAPGGLIRATVTLREGLIHDLTFSGDFTLLPASSLVGLEQSLRGAPACRNAVLSRVSEVYSRVGVQSPGVEPEDFAAAVAVTLEGAA